MADYPKTPWWSNLFAVLITFVVTLVGTLYATSGSGSGAAGDSKPKPIVTLFKDTFVYMPHALLLYGVIADMLTYEGVYSIASLIGILSLFVHFVFKFIWKGLFEVFDTIVKKLFKSGGDGFPAPPTLGADEIARMNSAAAAAATPKGGARQGSFFSTYTGCDIQGFEWAHSPYAPQTLVVIATIFSYYAFDLAQNRGVGNAGVTIGLGIVVFLTQLFLAGDCSLQAGEAGPEKAPVSKFYQAILAAAEGLFVGGVSYGVVQANYPNRLPSSTISPFPRMTPNMLRDGKFDSDGNPWVCVAGVCYPDMSSTDARKKFADIAAASTGNGRAARSEDCPAT